MAELLDNPTQESGASASVTPLEIDHNAKHFGDPVVHVSDVPDCRS